MSKSSHDDEDDTDDEKAAAITRVFSKNSRANN